MEMPGDMVYEEATGRWLPRIDPLTGPLVLDQESRYPLTELDEEPE